MRTYSKLGGDFSEVLDGDVIGNLVKTNDVIGSVLRINFMNERLIDLWCSQITSTEDLFRNTGTMSFKLKIHIANNLGLPDEIIQVISKFNQFRNSLAHGNNKDLSDQQILDLRNHIDHIKGYLDQPIGNVDDPKFRLGLGDGEVLYWNKPELSKNHKLLLLYMNFSLKATGIIRENLKNKGVDLSYTDYAVSSLPK